MRVSVLLALYLCGFVACTLQRRQFLEQLFNDYELTFPPRMNLTQDLEVTIGASLVSIDFVSEIEQYLEATLRLNIAWEDHFLTWNVSESDIPYHIITTRKKLWTPRVIVYNSAEEECNIIKDDDPILLFHRGFVIWTKFIHTKTSCKIDIAQFPFDRQVCSIEVGPTLLKYSFFVLRLNESAGYIAPYTESNEWHLTSSKQFIKVYTDDRKEKTKIVIEIALDRRYVFHIFKGILPPVCLSLMNCFVFRLPAADGERITMSISVLLSYTLYLSFINDSLPENSDTICIFSVYLSCLLILSILIILATIYSISLHQNTENRDGPIRVKTIPKNKVGCDVEEASKLRWIKNAMMYDKIAFTVFLSTTFILTTVCLSLMLI